MKTKEELNTLREEYEALSTKLAELTEDELAQVTGGAHEVDFQSETHIEEKEFHLYIIEEPARKKFEKGF